MFRLVLRGLMGLTVLWIVPVLLIRAQPYDDSELRSFLRLPEDCPAPCFIGIRPGVTTAEEAMMLLEGHAWVQAVNSEINDQVGHIMVEWNEAAAPNIAPDSVAQLYILNGIVYDMNIETTYPVGTIYLLAGPPQGTDSGWSRLGVVVSAYYFDRSLLVWAYTACPVTRSKFWKANMNLSFGDFRTVTGLSAINFAC